LIFAGDDHSAAPAPARAPAPPTVQVVEAIERTLPETKQLTGRLAAVEHVELRPRVGGYIAAVRFREGALVKRGDVLFELDARPYATAVARAKAQLRQAQARRTLAEKRAARARMLRAGDAISQAELETAEAEHADSAAAVEAARAWLRTTLIDLADTRVRAPIDGRAGEAHVTSGNLVSGGTANASLLTTIVSIDPLHVELDVDESTVRRIAAAGWPGSAARVQLPDEATPRDAKLDFLGNEIDAATGTARARAVLPNPDGSLRPGLFARVRLELGEPRPVVLVRDEAIGTSAQGRHVLVVKPDGVVELRRVELGEVIDGLRVIARGLGAGERVIVKGMARPGMTVTAQLVAEAGGAS
jgi:gold/copper resistance efflux system membrane fusion protein